MTLREQTGPGFILSGITWRFGNSRASLPFRSLIDFEAGDNLDDLIDVIIRSSILAWPGLNLMDDIELELEGGHMVTAHRSTLFRWETKLVPA